MDEAELPVVIEPQTNAGGDPGIDSGLLFGGVELSTGEESVSKNRKANRKNEMHFNFPRNFTRMNSRFNLLEDEAETGAE